MSGTITCPACGVAFEITKAFADQLQERVRAEIERDVARDRARIAAEQSRLQAVERETQAQLTAIDVARKSLNDEINRRLDAERTSLIASARAQAADDLSVELKDRDLRLAELDRKLADSRKTELALRQKERELIEKGEQQELEIQRRLDHERAQIREAAQEQAGKEHELRYREKEQQIESMRKQIDELKQRAEAGSQQARGESLELALEDLLKREFPFDLIEPVAKGVSGADVLQRVRTPSGIECGTILWESKRTRTWQDAWLAKLRQDQRAAKADLAALVSVTLPPTISTISCIENVWITSWPCALGAAMALRSGLVEVANQRRAMEGRHTKIEHLYEYMSGAEFRNRVQGIAEAFVTLRADLEAEKRTMQKQWAKREKLIELALGATIGMHGELRAIIGANLQELEGMSLIDRDSLSAPAQPAARAALPGMT